MGPKNFKYLTSTERLQVFKEGGGFANLQNLSFQFHKPTDADSALIQVTAWGQDIKWLMGFPFLLWWSVFHRELMISMILIAQ